MNERLATVIETTPGELRLIADSLDRSWDAVKLGAEVPRFIWPTKDGEIHFLIDQDSMHKERRPRK